MIPEPCVVLQSVDRAIGEALEAALRGLPGWSTAVDKAATRVEDGATLAHSVGYPGIAHQLDHLAGELMQVESMPRPAAIEALSELRESWAGVRGWTPPWAIKDRAG